MARSPAVHARVVRLDEPAEQSAILIDALAQAGVIADDAHDDGVGSCPVLVVAGAQWHDASELAHELGSRASRAILVLRRSLAQAEAWSWLERGVGDILEWTSTAPPAREIAARLRRWSAIDAAVSDPVVTDQLVAAAPAFRDVLERIVEAAMFTSDPVLVIGESGTGKELVARIIHALDRRAGKRDLVTVDATTVVPELAGSELFGHERGAFTGAITSREGACALADGGTLFLDEAGDLPLPLQGQLLRVLQEGAYKRVGGDRWLTTRFRLVAATHRDLLGGVANGTFRQDLYHRVARWTFRLPPLKERPADIVPLAERFARELLGSEVSFAQAVLSYLVSRDYPGNVRDLRNLVARMCGRHPGTGVITFADVPEQDRPATGASSVERELEQSAARAAVAGLGLREIGRRARAAAIAAALESAGGKVQKAAAQLQVTDRALHLELAKRENGA